MVVTSQAPTEAARQRATVITDTSITNRYILTKPLTFAPQYANIYFARLLQLRPLLRAAAVTRWGNSTSQLRHADTIVDATTGAHTPARDSRRNSTNSNTAPVDDSLRPHDQEDAMLTVITGVVFRHMKSKPSILAEYDHPSPHTLIPEPPLRATRPYFSPSDQIFLEDEQARCALNISGLSPSQKSLFITGVIVAVQGRENRNSGSFDVHDVTLVSDVEHLSSPLSDITPSSSGKLVCLVSGLGLSPSAVAPELLLECLRGTIDEDDVLFACRVTHTIIAGNLFIKAPPNSPSHVALSSDLKSKLASQVSLADRFVSALATSMPVSVMPGALDATNVLLPQQPLHRCLLPNAARSGNLFRAPNPHAMLLNGKRFVGTSGQNISDLALYRDSENEDGEDADAESVLDLLQLLVASRHLAPSCPDTLGCYPFREKDPFVLDEIPHVLFAGNQQQFGTRVVRVVSLDVNGHSETKDIGVETRAPCLVRLVSVPSFEKTGQAVFIDVDSLECFVREFSLTS